jgi:hypothetical protein
MTSATNRPYTETTLPDHTQLPEFNGINWREHPQSILLTDSIKPVLQKLYSNNRFRH